jgi:hypothetical protein
LGKAIGRHAKIFHKRASKELVYWEKKESRSTATCEIGFADYKTTFF